MLSGNKGDWSELYVLIKLIADGKLYQSDIYLNKDLNNIYEVKRAFKNQNSYILEFDRQEQINIIRIVEDERFLVKSYPLEEFEQLSKKIFNGIKSGKGLSFNILEVNNFLENASITKLKADSNIKSDIKLKIYDQRLAKETDLGFSIKSLIGSDSTLFNTGIKNNFIYKIKGNLGMSVSDFNSYTIKPPQRKSKISFRLRELLEKKFSIDFDGIQSSQLWKNLKMIDGDLPEILAYALLFRWVYGKSSLSDVAEILEKEDPMNFYNGEVSEQKMYEYKLKKFLTESAMGMTSEKVWLGEYDSFGGVIIAKDDGEIVCFHIYDFNLFRNYLINNTLFEQASTGEDETNPGNPRTRKGTKKYYYGWLYESEDDLNFKINLQVRFK